MKDSSVSYVFAKQNKKFVIGISIRTSNEHFQKEVPPLWNRFFTENLAEKIPNRLNPNFLAVYTDYEGDYTKPFAYLIGCEVSSISVIPKGMVGIEIPASEYALFTASGKFPQSMIAIWHFIWKSDLKRAYTTDFEVYLPDFKQQESPEVKLYIAIKK